jgi:hypothetical protein
MDLQPVYTLRGRSGSFGVLQLLWKLPFTVCAHAMTLQRGMLQEVFRVLAGGDVAQSGAGSRCLGLRHF